ncbi:MAG: DUF3185 family protein [Chlamydiales bacterium]|nr:DUF3185 family protein [Chlamydiales bacterium]
MRVRRVIGVILLLVGVGLLISGLMATQNILEKIASDATGEYSNQTLWRTITGTIVVIIGAFITISSFKKGKR